MEVGIRDGDLYVAGLDGWKGYVFVDLRVEVVRGVPELRGFGIQAQEGYPLDRERLASVPLRRLAKIAAAFLVDKRLDLPGLDALLDSHEPELPVRPRGGSQEFSRAVARVVRTAVAQGRSGPYAVRDAWGVSLDRANQYIREAKDDQELPDQDSRRPLPVPPKPRPAARRSTTREQRESSK